MATAAVIKLPLAAARSRSLSSTSSRIQLPRTLSLKSIAISAGEKPNFRVFSSISDRTLEKTSPTSDSGVLNFVKYRGLGNDFILVDNRDSEEPKITQEQAVKLCDRNFGIGADGVIFALSGVNGTDYTMRIFNSDGSEPEMCGNGVRCFAKYIAEIENLHGKQSFTVHTGAGLIVPEIQDDGKVKVDMGQPILKASDVPTNLTPNYDEAVVKAKLDVDGLIWYVTCVSMGNPHCVTFGSESHKDLQVDELNLAEIGPKFEHHVMFPARTNTEFVQVFSRNHLKMRVWERGAGATLACGTGACAVVVAAVLGGHADRMCGNGVRCFARFIAEIENLHGKQSFAVHTGTGLIVPEIQDDGKVKVDMGQPILKASDVPTKLTPNNDQAAVKAKLDVDGLIWYVTCVSMGNPHCVTFGSESHKDLQVDELNLAEIGPKFEHHVMFPARTNTEFVQVFSRNHLKMRVWERGAGATLVCGTGACAVVVAAVLEGHADRICTVDLPGGPLDIEWREADNHIYMTGPAELVFYGSVPP